MTSRDREIAHRRRLAAALAKLPDPLPPALARSQTDPTYDDLRRLIELARRVFRRLKDCRDPRCHLCASCVEAIWVQAARKPHAQMILPPVPGLDSTP